MLRFTIRCARRWWSGTFVLLAAACNGSDVTSPSAAVTAVSGTAPAELLSLTGRIAFVSNRNGNDEIYVMNANGTGVTRLTKNAAEDLEPAWSPDGHKIAFVSDRAGNDEIYVMNADGTGLARLTNNATNDVYPAWSPDGAKIAFASTRAGHLEIFAMNANGTGAKRLTTNLPFQGCGGTSVGQEILPTWSPGGGKIAFRHKTNCFGTVIDIMNPDGTGITQLTDARFAHKLAWGPAGKIVFDGFWSGCCTGHFEINVVTVTGAAVTRLTNNAVDDLDPSWSPDHSRITFTSNRNGNLEIYAMNASGSGVTRLTSNSAADTWPAWGP